MDHVGVFDAKTHLSKLVERASRGETILITRNGQPMAKLAPADLAPAKRLNCDEAIALMRDIRTRTSLGDGLSVRQLIEEGRRF